MLESMQNWVWVCFSFPFSQVEGSSLWAVWYRLGEGMTEIIFPTFINALCFVSVLCTSSLISHQNFLTHIFLYMTDCLNWCFYEEINVRNFISPSSCHNLESFFYIISENIKYVVAPVVILLKLNWMCMPGPSISKFFIGHTSVWYII
jgi:hypothetical protein